MKITLTNDFHGTETNMIVYGYGYLGYEVSVRAARRAQRKLCGVAGCRCGITRGGRYDLCIDDGRAWIEDREEV